MRILFDQATPVPLRPHLRGHLVRTAAQEGWDRLRNGDLLAAAEKAGFDLLMTTDKNMVHQQNLTGRRIAILTLSCQQWPRLRPHVQLVIEALNAVKPGTYAKVDIPIQ
ncbi:MAG TPA: hypothetical protein VG267_16135 [Terracidiphilus sp.]|jgi:predicted nuclease of predicted toxin-antitoxin system|nr:hypothetical protein [Terracidiphilus sp.]